MGLDLARCRKAGGATTKANPLLTVERFWDGKKKSDYGGGIPCSQPWLDQYGLRKIVFYGLALGSFPQKMQL